MATVNKFEDLIVWQKARKLAFKIYKLTLKKEFSRDYKLIDQWRGASGSIMDNIAEGFDRQGTNEFIHFLSISTGSSSEVKSQGYRALDNGYITEEEFNEVYSDAHEIYNMIYKLMDYLKKTDIRGNKFKKT
jgi:four helix bundle protein